ncbi:MAG: AI-2E family transporter [Spirochaetes bacterium]|nr:AI-2E family transporter [Spirochaetota bacterium]
MQSNETKILKNILLILFIFAFFGLLYFTHIMAEALVPIFFAFFTSMLLQPFITRLQKLKLNFFLSSTIVYTIFILMFALIIFFLTFSLGSFFEDLPKFAKELRDQIIDFINYLSKNDFVRKYIYQEDIMTLIMDSISQFITIKNFNDYFLKPLGFTLDLLKAFGIFAIALIFLIPGMNNLSLRILEAFPDKNGPRINNIISNVMDQLQNYVVAKFIVSFFVGFFSFFILIAFKIKYPFVWSVILFIFNFVPYIGSIIAVGFPLLMSIIQHNSLLGFIFLGVFLIIIQQIMGNIVEPQLMSKKVNLSPIVILTSLIIWGYIWGLMGVILAVPIMSVINVICFNIEALRPFSVLISTHNHKGLKKTVNKDI